MTIRNLLFPLLLLSPAAFAVDSVRTDHFVPAASAAAQHRFSCQHADGSKVDAEIAYVATRKAAGHAGLITALGFSGREATPEVLEEANRRLQGKVVEGVTVSCQSDGSLRLMAKLWTPGEGEQKVGWLVVMRSAEGDVAFH